MIFSHISDVDYKYGDMIAVNTEYYGLWIMMILNKHRVVQGNWLWKPCGWWPTQAPSPRSPPSRWAEALGPRPDKAPFQWGNVGKKKNSKMWRNKQILTSPSVVTFSNSSLMVTDFFATCQLKFNTREKRHLLLVSNFLLIKIDSAFAIITSMSTSKILSSLDLSLMTDILGLLLSYFWKGFPPFKTLLTI